MIKPKNLVLLFSFSLGYFSLLVQDIIHMIVDLSISSNTTMSQK